MKESNAEKLKRYRKEALAKGLCNVCRSRVAKLGCRTCQRCIDMADARKARRPAKGVCSRCPNPTTGGRWCCDECTKRHTEHNQRRCEERVSEGLCRVANCGSPHVHDRTMCLYHLELMAEKARIRKRGSKPFVRVYHCSECGEPGHQRTVCGRLRSSRFR